MSTGLSAVVLSFCFLPLKQYHTIRLLAAGLVFTGLTAQAQFTEKYKPARFGQQFDWAEVTLNSGETLPGPLTLHWSEDLLILTQPGQPVLPVTEISHFRVRQQHPEDAFDHKKYFDFGPMRRGYYPGRIGFAAAPSKPCRLSEMPLTASRVFHTCYWSQRTDNQNFRALGFFEQLSAGPVMLLRRQALELKTVSYVVAGGYNSYTKIEKKDGLYLSLPDGSLVFLEKPQDFYDQFSALIPQLQEFARQHHLGFSKPHELAYLVNYANSLGAKPQP